MAYTRKQVVTCVSIVYLIITTALAGYAASRASKFSIPLSDVLAGFTTALPIASGLLLECGYQLNRRGERRRGAHKGETPRPPLIIIANTLIFIYTTVVVTLLGTHIAPASDLRCGLDEHWRQMFQHKEMEPIRTIQDAFNCCGLMSTHDKAWPFPDKSHSARSCEETYGRTTACFGPWRQEEQRVAGMLMGAAFMVFVWQFAIIAVPRRRDSWLHQIVPDRVSRLIADVDRNDRPRRAIDYLPNFSHYRDAAREEIEEEEEDASTPQAIEGGRRENSQHVLPGPDEGHLPHSTLDNAWARNG